MAMTWHDLLFMHWPVHPDALRPLVPSSFSIATFNDPGGSPSAWLAVVPFRMSGIRHRILPPIPGLSAFPELNVRTYVTGTVGGRPVPGVWFFSLDAASAIAVRVARAVFHLPFMEARMTCREEDGWVAYSSRRTRYGTPPASFQARYRPVGQPAAAPPGTIEHFLTERYCLYTVDPQGRLYQGRIHHNPWPLQSARCELDANSMASPLGLNLPEIEAVSGPPLLHFARRLSVRAWLPRPVS
jgi:uncharacterized protein YqjF (DUF2071 family)